MARKKVEDFMKAGQNYNIIGEVKSAKVEEKTSSAGNTYNKYSARLKTANGVTIFINKNRFNNAEGEEPSFVSERFEKWEELIETDFEKERVFVQVSSRKQEGKPMYNWLTNFKKDDGQISYNVDGFMFKINHLEDVPEKDEEECKVVLYFKNSAIAFKDTKLTFNSTMYVKDIEDNKLYLTDGKEAYSNDLYVELPNDMENKAKIGQGYEFRLKIEKGKRHKVETGTTNWGDEGGTSTYDPDKCIVEAVVGVVKDMVLPGISSKAKGKKRETVTEESPF